jgi:hypothetical protein
LLVSDTLSIEISFFLFVLDSRRGRTVVSENLSMKISFFFFFVLGPDRTRTVIEFFLKLVVVKLQIHDVYELTGSSGNE